MKKFKTMMAMMLALVSMCVAFSSCSSDDDDNNGAGSSATAEQVVGTYVGETMSIALAGQGDMEPLENATFKLEKVDDSHVNIILPAFGSAPMALPSITVKNLAVTESMVLILFLKPVLIKHWKMAKVFLNQLLKQL